MDRRTLIVVIALTLVLFFVNNYFSDQHQQELREWHKQQKEQKVERQQELEDEVRQFTAKEHQLPLVTFYATQARETSLGTAIEEEGTLLTIAADAEPAEIVYALVEGKTTPFTLATSNPQAGSPIVYTAKDALPLKTMTLPHFGTFRLQLVTLPQAQVTLATYTDGQFDIPALDAARIANDLNGTTAPLPTQGAAIALFQSTEGYVPIGWFNSAEQRLIPIQQLSSLSDHVTQPPAARIAKQGDTTAEEYYVLENEYQQLVFSNHGGALAEINLPFESETHPSSVVKPVEFDRLMVENHPYNARFPAHPYKTADQKRHDQGALGGYYPLIRRDLIEQGQRKSVRVPPQYYALNIISDKFNDVASLTYSVKEFTANRIVFESVQPHRRITKTFSLPQDVDAPYTLDLSVTIEGDARNLWLSSGIPEVEWISGAPAPALKIRETLKGKPSVTELSLPKDMEIVSGRKPDWLSNGNGFFGLIQDPLVNGGEGYLLQYVPGSVVPSRLVEIDQEYDLYPADKMPGYLTMLPLNKKGGKMEFRVFAGPYSSAILNQVDAAFADPETGYTPDFTATQTFHGWFAFISEPFAKLLWILMNFFHTITGSWGISIILLTLALRLMLYPLNAWSTKSMLKMKEVAPLAQKIQEKYKKDPKKLQLETMNLYREKGVNPVSGCFPLLIQIPFLMGMFGLLRSTFELRGASFIPGWIDNLAAPDVIFSWGMPIFIIGNELHLLPFLVGGVMLMQQHMMSTFPKDPSQWTDQQRQQRAMGNIMSLVMVFIFYSMPSGLNLYFLFSTFFGVVQQWWTSKNMKTDQPQVVVETPRPQRRK